MQTENLNWESFDGMLHSSTSLGTMRISAAKNRGETAILELLTIDGWVNIHSIKVCSDQIDYVGRLKGYAEFLESLEVDR